MKITITIEVDDPKPTDFGPLTPEMRAHLDKADPLPATRPKTWHEQTAAIQQLVASAMAAINYAATLRGPEDRL
jgi:hypothetical protein